MKLNVKLKIEYILYYIVYYMLYYYRWAEEAVLSEFLMVLTNWNSVII